MTIAGRDRRRPVLLGVCLVVPGGLALLVCFLLVFYRPDRPIPVIAPASSPEPAFAVQIIRPRAGLPLGGIVPPRLFGIDAQIGFDSASPGAAVFDVAARRIEIGAADWNLLLVLDDAGRVDPETRVDFNLVFEERRRKVRCRPSDPAAGVFETVTLGESGEVSGHFDIEVARCIRADTGMPLAWPPKPLVLRGSFDRLPLDSDF